MPNGDRVRFPDDMPKEQIRAKIQEWFPDAYKGLPPSKSEAAKPETEKPAAKEGEGKEYKLPLRNFWEDIKGLAHGAGQATMQTALGLGHVLPGRELPFLPEESIKARREGEKTVQQWADKPSESGAQTAGKVIGTVAPWLIGSPVKIAGALTTLPKVGPELLKIAQQVPRAAEFGSMLTDSVERAAMGSLWGASQAEEDKRQRGAILGAMSTGLLPFGELLTTPLGKLASVGARGALGAGTAATMNAMGFDPEHYGLGGAAAAALPFGRIGKLIGEKPIQWMIRGLEHAPEITGPVTEKIGGATP